MYYVFCIFECLRAPRKMGKCSLALPSLNKDFIIIIINIIIITRCPVYPSIYTLLQSIEAVSLYRDAQPQVTENYLDSFYFS